MAENLKDLGKAFLSLLSALCVLGFEIVFMCFLWCVICWGFGLDFTWQGGVALWAAAKALNVAIGGLNAD